MKIRWLGGNGGGGAGCLYVRTMVGTIPGGATVRGAIAAGLVRTE